MNHDKHLAIHLFQIHIVELCAISEGDYSKCKYGYEEDCSGFAWMSLSSNKNHGFLLTVLCRIVKFYTWACQITKEKSRNGCPKMCPAIDSKKGNTKMTEVIGF